MKILVTGAAGFIGSQTALRLAQRGDEVIGIDNLNTYYDVRLKIGRLAQCGIQAAADMASNVFCQSSLHSNLRFLRLDIDDRDALAHLFLEGHFDKVVNLAAQAGVRYSISNPYAYLHSNLTGFLNILENCRQCHVPYLLFASSSSVYGLNSKVPFSEADDVSSPVSLYAATKRSDELMAHAYSKLYGFQTVGLRYFTVYGPWGRPDMAPMLFTRSILSGESIRVFNNGNLARDFTYIDDIVEGTLRLLDHTLDVSLLPNAVPFSVFNIGQGHPVPLMDFIGELEQALGRQAIKQYLPMQPGDVYQTYADTTKLQQIVGYKPLVALHEGIMNFVKWYKSDSNPLLR
jgi:UDP-glucuronate 4-epimerase